MSCDHTIGFLNKWVNESEIKELLISESKGWNDHTNVLIAFGDNLKDRKNNYVPKDFLDRRKALMTMFTYCPYCGEEIDWKEIKALF